MNFLSWPGEPDEETEEAEETEPDTHAVVTQAKRTGPTYTCQNCDIEEHIGALDQDYAGRPVCPECGGRME